MSTPPTASLPGLVPQSSRAPEIDPTARLLFIINAASGRNDSDTTRQVIEEALTAAGRTGELLFTRPDELARAAKQAAATACCARAGTGGFDQRTRVSRQCESGSLP